MKHKIYIPVIMILFGIFSNASAQHEGGQTIDREPYAAGKFYTDNADSLRAMLGRLFKQAAPRDVEKPRAIIVPHAGYVYSGQVAASGFNQIDPEAEYDNIFIIASSHRMTFEGASVYYRGNYITPLGVVNVNQKLAKELHDNHKVFSFADKAHDEEHSLEVQLPFLQYHLKKAFEIVPIIIGVRDHDDCDRIAKALEPYFTDKNLFVISTDFSHYPAYEDAREVDEETANAIIQNDVDKLSETLMANGKKKIPELATSLCGWSSVFTLLHLTEGKKNLHYRKIEYMNSGDQVFGDKDHVVGYQSIVVYEKKDDESNTRFSLKQNEKNKLLEIARTAIKEYLRTGEKPDFDTLQLPLALMQSGGAFVSLYKNKELRGCIGRFNADGPLYLVVRDMAIAAATSDNRFQAVNEDEMHDINIEISVLTPLKKISSIDEIELGRDGIYIRKGYVSGTFLPQVADKTGWDKEEFVSHCARDKAGIGWNGWKNAELFTYQALVFAEE